MAVQHRHHRRQPRSKRLVRRIGHQFIVLDEINPRSAQRIHQLRRLLGTQANAGFDDRAHQGSPVHTRQLARALDAKRRPLKLCGISRRQIQIEQAQSRDLTELKQIARHRGQERRQIGPHVVHRKRNLDFGPLKRPVQPLALQHSTVQRGLRAGRHRQHTGDPGTRALFQLRGFARQGDKGATGLLPGNDFGHFVGGHRAFNEIPGCEFRTRTRLAHGSSLLMGKKPAS